MKTNKLDETPIGGERPFILTFCQQPSSEAEIMEILQKFDSNKNRIFVASCNSHPEMITINKNVKVNSKICEPFETEINFLTKRHAETPIF